MAAYLSNLMALISVLLENVSLAWGNLNSEMIKLVWLLVSVILSNGYRSFVANKATAPFASNAPETFGDLGSLKFAAYSTNMTGVIDSTDHLFPESLFMYRKAKTEFESEMSTMFQEWMGSQEISEVAESFRMWHSCNSTGRVGDGILTASGSQKGVTFMI